MRRRSLQLDGEEIPNYCELRPSTDNAAANNYYNVHINPGREEEVPAIVQRRQRRVTITATTPPLPPLQMTAMPATSRGGVCGFASPPHRPLAVQTILSTASALLLLIVIGDICFFSANNSNKYTTDDINDLTQTVMRLSQELHDAQIDNERTHNELELVEKDLSDNKIELERETHYVRSMEERNRLMKESMLDQIHKDQINIIDTTKAATEIAARQKQEHEVQLMKEHDENIQLRVELAKSIEELDRVRRIQKQQQQLKAPIGFEDEEEESRAQRDELSGSNSSNTKSYERLLRGGISNYQPGDSIEIIERIQHDDGVTKIALRPGESWSNGAACERVDLLSTCSIYSTLLNSFISFRNCRRFQLRWHLQPS